MDGKVLLLDANDAKVGETFFRRARQLVSQQRAEWVDESHNAIRFAPDTDDWREETAYPAAAEESADDDNWIYNLAVKRLKDRKWFIIHAIALFPVYIFLYGIASAVFYSRNDVSEFFMFTAGAWTMASAIHMWYFFKTYLKGYRPAGSEERRARRLANEVERLRRMEYRR